MNQNYAAYVIDEYSKGKITRREMKYIIRKFYIMARKQWYMRGRIVGEE